MDNIYTNIDSNRNFSPYNKENINENKYMTMIYIPFLIEFYKKHQAKIQRHRNLYKELFFEISKECFKVCINSNNIDFEECFDNCEVKLMSIKFIQDASKYREI